MDIVKRRKDAWAVALVLFAVYLSMLEALIPKPFPWMKIGLANIAAIIAVKKFGVKFAIEITFLRVLIYGIFFSTLFTPGFFISFIAGIISTILMAVLVKMNKFSLVAVSSAAGVVHNIMQLITAYVMLFRGININERGILIFVAIFLGTGAVSGIFTGIAASKIIGYKEIKNRI